MHVWNRLNRGILLTIVTAACAIAPSARAQSAAQATPCLIVTLTGTSGPPPYNGLAGPGTLVTYGNETNGCRSVLLQFDVGRGTLMRLSQIDVQATQLDAVFFTHMHSDHMEGFSDVVQMRWIFGSPRASKLDIVCAADAKSPYGPDLSCRKFVAHINDAYELSGETAYRVGEMKGIVNPAGPIADLNVITFEPGSDAHVVWASGPVKVSAIRTTHIPGSVAFRVDTPVGSVAIGGDSSNDIPAPPRRTSTSDELEKLAKGVDVIVNTAIHPVLSPERGASTPPEVYYRQSNATDLGAMAQRDGAKYLMLTHLAPPIGAAAQGSVSIRGGPLTEGDYRQAALDGGFTGEVVVGTDLASVRLPPK
ncbi:MAG: MBL fold metallo-hydrolase [Acetobacteraceae bacterium]